MEGRDVNTIETERKRKDKRKKGRINVQVNLDVVLLHHAFAFSP
jgi:hypothetical protein